MEVSAISQRTISVQIRLEGEADIRELHGVLEFLNTQNRLPDSLDLLRHQLRNFADGVI